MGLSTSIVLIAVGAVLRYAVTATITGLKVHVVGDILMGVGAFGLVLCSLLWVSSSLEARRSGRAGSGQEDRRRYEDKQVSTLRRDLPENQLVEEDEEETRRVA